MIEPTSVMPSDNKFSENDVANLRNELLLSGLDSWQAAELIFSFLTARGYGISTCEARNAFTRMDASHCSLQNMQAELEQLAMVM
jgi:hypothetical protein